MGSLSAALLKCYRCATWTPGDDHGGDIDTGNEITTGVDQSIFDDVTNSERVSGMTDYRKVAFRNENSGVWPGIRAYIAAFTPSTDDEISILQGGTKSKTGTPVALTGTATFAASTAVTGSGTSFLSELAPGEKIYNATNDSESDGKVIASIESDTALTLAEAYAGTTGAGKTANVAGIDQSSAEFVSPDAYDHADVLVIGDKAQNEYFFFWIKRVVGAGAGGYTENTFTIAAVQT